MRTLSIVLARSRCAGGLACNWLWLTLASPHSLADPGWASISRGVLVCDECCSVHRSLGRHISIVKHLRHSAWPPTLLQVRDWPALLRPTGCSPQARLPQTNTHTCLHSIAPGGQHLPGEHPNPNPNPNPSTHLREEASRPGVRQTWALISALPHVALSRSLTLSQPWHAGHVTWGSNQDPHPRVA